MSSVQELLKGWAKPKTKTGNYSAAQTAVSVWQPTSGKKIVLTGVLVSTDTAMNVTVKQGDTTVIPSVYLAANSSTAVGGSGWPIWVGDKDESLTFTSSANGKHSVMLYGYEI